MIDSQQEDISEIFWDMNLDHFSQELRNIIVNYFDLAHIQT